MLCTYCQSFDFRAMAADLVANLSDPLRKDDHYSATYGSELFHYHNTMLGMQCAIAQGCDLCSLLWETWLKNSPNWEWGGVEDFLFSDEEVVPEEHTEKYKTAILNSPESFKPSLEFTVCKVWNDNPKAKIGDRLFRNAVACVSFEVKGGDHGFLDEFSSRTVKLGIYAKAGIESLQTRSNKRVFS